MFHLLLIKSSCKQVGFSTDFIGTLCFCIFAVFSEALNRHRNVMLPTVQKSPESTVTFSIPIFFRSSLFRRAAKWERTGRRPRCRWRHPSKRIPSAEQQLSHQPAEPRVLPRCGCLSTHDGREG